jgi:hypothetical protein
MSTYKCEAVRAVAQNGSLIIVSLTVSPVKDANGKIVGASKIARDVTEQKKNQELIVTLAREAHVHRWSTNPISARRRSGSCGSVA